MALRRGRYERQRRQANDNEKDTKAFHALS